MAASPSKTRRIEARTDAPAASRLLRPPPEDPGRLVNQGRGRRTELGTLSGTGRTALARYDLDGSSWPVVVSLWERHPWSDQLFLALDDGDALAVVTPTAPDGGPELSGAEAWRIGPGTPFLYPAGLWHAPLFAIERRGRFLMAIRETGRGDDTEEWRSDIALSVGPGRPNDGTG